MFRVLCFAAGMSAYRALIGRSVGVFVLFTEDEAPNPDHARLKLIADGRPLPALQDTQSGNRGVEIVNPSNSRQPHRLIVSHVLWIRPVGRPLHFARRVSLRHQFRDAPDFAPAGSPETPRKRRGSPKTGVNDPGNRPFRVPVATAAMLAGQVRGRIVVKIG